MLMGITEYAKSREISPRFLYKLITQGKVPAGREGRKWLLIPEKVDAAIDALFGTTAIKVEVPEVKKGNYKAGLAALAEG